MPSLLAGGPSAAALPKRLPEGASGQRARVLIIDDDELTTSTFAQMLRLEGHEVLTQQNAVVALEEITRFRPDAIIVDLHMPVMDGLTFITNLRSRPLTRSTPVAMVTGDYAMSQTVCDQLNAMAVTLCFKPLWLDDLVELTNRMLEPAEN